MYLNPKKSPDGAYPPLQSSVAPDLLVFPDEFLPQFYMKGKRFSGFVDIFDDGKTVTFCEWNEEAYLAYAETHPEPEPVPEPEVEPDVWDELAEAYRQGVQSAYDE